MIGRAKERVRRRKRQESNPTSYLKSTIINKAKKIKIKKNLENRKEMSNTFLRPGTRAEREMNN